MKRPYDGDKKLKKGCCFFFTETYLARKITHYRGFTGFYIDLFVDSAVLLKHRLWVPFGKKYLCFEPKIRKISQFFM